MVWLGAGSEAYQNLTTFTNNLFIFNNLFYFDKLRPIFYCICTILEGLGPLTILNNIISCSMTTWYCKKSWLFSTKYSNIPHSWWRLNVFNSNHSNFLIIHWRFMKIRTQILNLNSFIKTLRSSSSWHYVVTETEPAS